MPDINSLRFPNCSRNRCDQRVMDGREKIIKILRENGVGVLPTDTLYGIVGSALSKKAVARIYRLRKRNSGKPMIVLIGSISDLKTFGVKINEATLKNLQEIWPGKVSVILHCPNKKFEYLHRGTGAVAFRVPAMPSLRRLLKKTGPLVAPSANLEGLPPAQNILEAKKYFGDSVDFYYGRKKSDILPSTILAYASGKWSIKRQGVYLPEFLRRC